MTTLAWPFRRIVLVVCLLFLLGPSSLVHAQNDPTPAAPEPSVQGQTPELPSTPAEPVVHAAPEPSVQGQTPELPSTPAEPAVQAIPEPSVQGQLPELPPAPAEPAVQATPEPSVQEPVKPDLAPKQPDEATLALLSELARRRGFLPPGNLFSRHGFPAMEALWIDKTELLPGMFRRTASLVGPDTVDLCYHSPVLQDRFCFDLLHPQQARRGYVSGPAFAVGLPVGPHSYSAWAAWYELASVLVSAKPSDSPWCRLETEQDKPPARLDEDALIARLLDAAKDLALQGDQAARVDGLLDAAKSLASRPNLSLELFGARWLWFTGNPESAKAGLSRLKQNQPAEADIDLELARLDILSGDASAGLATLQKIFDETGRPAKDCGLAELARWQRAQNPEADVLAWLAMGVELFPACTDARLELAQCLAERGRTAEAVEHLNLVLAEKGDRASDWLQKARWLIRLDQPDEALAALEQAFRSSEDVPIRVRLLREMGRIAPVARNRAEFAAYLEKRLSEDAGDAFALHGLCALAFFGGRFAEAARLAERLRDVFPQDDAALAMGMMAHHESDEPVLAERWLALLQARPVVNDADLLYALAMMNETSNPARAIGYLQTALALPPEPGAHFADTARMRQALDLLNRGLPVPFWRSERTRMEDVTLDSLMEVAGLDGLPSYLWWVLFALFPLGYLAGIWRGTSRWP